MAVGKPDGGSPSTVQARVPNETLGHQRLGSANPGTSRFMEGNTQHGLEMQGGAGRVNASVMDGTEGKEMKASLDGVRLHGSMQPQTTGELREATGASAA